MTGPVRSTRAERVGALTPAGTGGGTRSGRAMTALAGRVAGSIGCELGLLERQGRGGGGRDDPYEVLEAARSLNGDLGGRPVDEGLLARSLGAFVTESASLIAARPRAPSLQLIEQAIARAQAETRAPETVATALNDIDRTTAYVASDATGRGQA